MCRQLGLGIRGRDGKGCEVSNDEFDEKGQRSGIASIRIDLWLIDGIDLQVDSHHSHIGGSHVHTYCTQLRFASCCICKRCRIFVRTQGILSRHVVGCIGSRLLVSSTSTLKYAYVDFPLLHCGRPYSAVVGRFPYRLNVDWHPSAFGILLQLHPSHQLMLMLSACVVLPLPPREFFLFAIHYV